jgi:hypothetical protein
VGFEGKEVLRDFRPQWHHVFPRKFLESRVREDLIDALANIAVIGPTINIRISAKDPMDYIDRYGISPEKLAQQYVDPDVGSMLVDNFEAWLAARANRLAEASNSFLAELRPHLSGEDG